MNHPLLNQHRGVVFNPCYPSGDTLTESVANVTTASLAIAHGNPRGDGVRLLRNTPMGEACEMLLTAKARFDVIVSAPPAGTTPAKGIPKPQKAADTMPKPAGRKLFTDSAAAAPASPEIDLGYATFLVANALLSPFGEAMLDLLPESYELVQKDLLFSRVWCVAAQPDGRTRLYIARDHRPLPGAPLNHAQDRRHIRGSILQYGGSDTAESLRKFTAVRDELMKRAAGNTGLEFNVYLEGNKLRTRFMQFAIESGATPPSLVSDAQQLLYGKTLIDLAVMRSTRDQTKAILTDKRLKVPPDLLRAWDEACRQIAILGAPFARPSPVQRVAWLDEQETITCTSEFAGDFKRGNSYVIRTHIITGKKLEYRHRPGHSKKEEVLVSGQEVVVAIVGENGHKHIFTQFPITEKMADLHYTYVRTKRAHTLEDLIVNFAMPEVQDIAEADPASYLKYRNRLEALQTTT
jgi:hypothetical protein